MESKQSLSQSQLIEHDSSDEDMDVHETEMYTDSEMLFISLAQDWLDNNASQILKSLIQPKAVGPAAGKKPKLARTAASRCL